MKTLFAVAVPSGSSVLTVDGLAYDGKLWLVPLWNDYPQENESKPTRMIRFDNLQHEATPPNSLHDYLVQQQVPQSVLDGETDEGFEILKGDQITFGIRRVQKSN